MSARLRALLIVVAALTTTALPTAAAFASPPHVSSTVAHSTTPREEIQPATNITGQLARRVAERSTGKPLGLIPEQTNHHIALKAPLA